MLKAHPKYRLYREFLHSNQHYFYCLPKHLRIAAKYFIRYPRETKPQDSPTLFNLCKILVHEKRKVACLKNKGDFIEGLDMHNIDKPLYDFCKSIRIHSIHELDSFVTALKSQSSQAQEFKIKYPQGTDLIAFYDRYRNRNPDRTHNPPG
jgi:hypothetical protein